MSHVIKLMDAPIRVTGAPPNEQELRLAVDVSAFDQLDMLLTVYEGESVQVQLITGMEVDSEDGWVNLGTAIEGPQSGHGATKGSFTSPLRYIRWKHTAVSPATFMVCGVGRTT